MPARSPRARAEPKDVDSSGLATSATGKSLRAGRLKSHARGTSFARRKGEQRSARGRVRMKANKQSSESQGAEGVVYIQLLAQAQHISDRSLGRLRDLCGRFPAALPDDLIGQIERIRTDTPHE